MAVSRDNRELVERYLLDQLSEEEKAVFQAQLLRDADLREELRQVRHLQKAMLAQKLRLKKEGNRRSRWLFWASSVFTLVLLSILWIYYSRPTGGDSSLLPPPKETTPLQPPPKTPASTPPPEQQTVPKTTQGEPKPIAGNYSPNPDLEDFIGTTVRSGAFQLTITQPLPNARLNLHNGQAGFQLTGTIEGKPITENQPLQVHLFSNKKEDYQRFKPLQTWPLTLKPEAGQHIFDIKAQLSLSPGLYYYLLENAESGEIMHVGRLEVH